MRNSGIFIKLLLTLVVSFLGGKILGQQDAQWSHVQFNHQYYNPGYVGLEHISRATMLNRNQWAGYETTVVEDQAGGAPSQQEIALMHP